MRQKQKGKMRGEGNVFERAVKDGTHSFLFLIYYFLFEKHKPSGLLL